MIMLINTFSSFNIIASLQRDHYAYTLAVARLELFLLKYHLDLLASYKFYAGPDRFIVLDVLLSVFLVDLLLQLRWARAHMCSCPS